MTVHAGVLTSPADAPAQAVRARWGFPELFVISQTALPALLYLPGTQAFRLPIRTSAFAISLLAFAWWLIESTIQVPHSRVQSWLAAVMALLGLMLFHPQTTSLLGGVAHIAVYFAVMAPLFWAPVFVRTPEHLARLLWLLLICSGVNSVVGVLQVYDPARFLPAEFSRVITANRDLGLGPVTFIGANGERIVRPPGLFDMPGAVAGPGMSAALLGLIFATSAMAMWKRLLSLAFAGAGLAAIYLSQVRISLVMTGVMMTSYVVIAMRQRRLARATQFSVLAGALLIGALVLAIALGGPTIQERVLTLFSGTPLSVYEHARGAQLRVTFRDLLFEHPFGAGLARWGMAASYFGTFTNDSPSLWAEIQFTGWMIDGGILLIVLYCGALIVAGQSQWRLAMLGQHPRLATSAAVVMSVNLGVAALIFSFTPFNTQIGIQYWFLAGALHGIGCSYGSEGA
jgi:hypothetical protein